MDFGAAYSCHASHSGHEQRVKAGQKQRGLGSFWLAASGVNQNLFEISVLCARDQSTSELFQEPMTKPSWMLLSYKHRRDSSQKETNLRDDLFLKRKSGRAKSSRRTRKLSALTFYHFPLEFYTFFLI